MILGAEPQSGSKPRIKSQREYEASLAPFFRRLTLVVARGLFSISRQKALGGGSRRRLGRFSAESGAGR